MLPVSLADSTLHLAQTGVMLPGYVDGAFVYCDPYNPKLSRHRSASPPRPLGLHRGPLGGTKP